MLSSSCRFRGLLVLAMAVFGVIPGFALEWPGWQIPGSKVTDKGALTIIEDADAESTRPHKAEDGTETQQKVLLEQNVSRRAIAKAELRIVKTPNVPWKDFTRGLYEMKVRLRFQGDLGVIGTPIVLQAMIDKRGEIEKAYYPCDFKQADDFQELTMLVELDPEGPGRLAARPTSGPRRSNSFYSEAYPSTEPTQPVDTTSKFFNLQVVLPVTKYSSEFGTPPNSLRRVQIDWVKLELVERPTPLVRYVRPQLLWQRPGAENTFNICVQNPTEAAASPELRVSLIHGFNETTVVHTETLALAAGEIKTLQVPWPTTAETPIWGYEVRAELLQGGQVISSDHDYFSVHPRVYDVHVMGSNMRQNNPYREHESYQNLTEVFGATPGDCARVMPQGENWMSGMLSGGSAFTMPIVKTAIQRNKANGIATHFYLFAGGTSVAFMDLYVAHPEWVSYRVAATDETYSKSMERIKAIREHDWRKGYIDPSTAPTPHVEAHLNFWFPELVDRVVQDAVAFIKATGYDGVRWDVGLLAPRTTKTILGTELPYNMDDAQQQAADNWNAFAKATKAADPNFEFGANMDSWAYLEQVGNRKSEPEPVEKYKEFLAFAASGGMFMDEGTMNAPFFSHYMNRWEDMVWSTMQKRECATSHGGVYQLFSPHRNSAGFFAHDDIYFHTFLIATGSYYVGKFSAPPYSRESMGAFITRFSEVFRSKNRRLLEGAADLIYVDSLAELWFADMTTYENIGATRRYVIPLVNPPVVERLRRNKINELPPPIEEPFNVEVKIPEGFTKGTAWMVSWEPTIGATPLELKVDGDTATATLPELQLFRTLVIDFEP